MTNPIPSMPDDEYLAVQHSIVSFAGIVADIPLQPFIEMIQVAHVTGPLLDPTLYRRGVKRMEQIQRLAVALRAFQQEALAVKAEWQAEIEKGEEQPKQKPTEVTHP